MKHEFPFLMIKASLTSSSSSSLFLVLLANAWHHRSDAFSSIVALISIWGATSGGIPALDPLGGLFVAGMVGITGLRVGWSAFTQLTDTQDFALKQAVEDAVQDAILEYQLQDDVLGLHAVRTRYLGSSAWVDLEVETNPSRSTSAATQVVRVLKNAILKKIPAVTDVVVVLKTKQDVVAELNAGTTMIHGEDSTLLNPIEEAVHPLPAVSLSVSPTEESTGIVTPALTPLQVEANVRGALATSRVFAPDSRVRLHGVESVLVHFHENGSDVDIIVSVGESAANSMSVSEARRLAQTAKEDVIANASGVVDAKVSLELVRKQQDEQQFPSVKSSFSENPIGTSRN
jgi:divalent metal cation (Fe/Co/Zn/Cd) transporter